MWQELEDQKELEAGQKEHGRKGRKLPRSNQVKADIIGLQGQHVPEFQ
jgi:hypothetical protein